MVIFLWFSLGGARLIKGNRNYKPSVLSHLRESNRDHSIGTGFYFYFLFFYQTNFHAIKHQTQMQPSFVLPPNLRWQFEYPSLLAPPAPATDRGPWGWLPVAWVTLAAVQWALDVSSGPRAPQILPIVIVFFGSGLEVNTQTLAFAFCLMLPLTFPRGMVSLSGRISPLFFCSPSPSVVTFLHSVQHPAPIFTDGFHAFRLHHRLIFNRLF